MNIQQAAKLFAQTHSQEGHREQFLLEKGFIAGAAFSEPTQSVDIDKLTEVDSNKKSSEEAVQPINEVPDDALKVDDAPLEEVSETEPVSQNETEVSNEENASNPAQ